MKIKHILVCILSLVLCTPAFAQIGMKELGDSLTVWTGFSRVWSPAVRVKQMRVSGNNVTLKTNHVLHDVRWTPEKVADIKRQVSLWTLGHTNGKVTIYTGSANIENLITECARQAAKRSNSVSVTGAADLTDRQIVLYPSHGLYFNTDRQEWIWQRATLWTTVEDLYSQEYVRQVKQMLENAGATVLSPRAGLDQLEPGQSGMPRWTEGARYNLMQQNADTAIWDLYEGNHYKDDMKCRAMWVNSLENAPDLCVAFHTDGLDSGDDTTIVGTLVIYTAKDDDGHTTLRDGRDREKTNRNLADYIQTQVTEDLQHIAPEWTRRQLHEANYCETRVPVVPSIILELLSHKNMADMKYGLDPAFRYAAARAVYKGILRYLNGNQAVVQPLPVRDLAINTDGLLQWIPTLDTLEQSAAPTYYMVYTQANDGAWDVQQVNKTQLQLDLQPGVAYNCYVVAGNNGGLSLPSPVISAYLTDPSSIVNSPIVHIIDAFNDVYGPTWFADSTYAGIVQDSYACEDGFSCAYIGQQWNYTRTSPWVNDDNCGFGSCYRNHAGQFTVGNTHDYAVRHGRVLRQMGLSYVSCTGGYLSYEADQGAVLMDVVCGRNRKPLTTDLYMLLAKHIASGGKVLLSSDHIDAIDQRWLKTCFHAGYYAANATRSGRIIGADHQRSQLLMWPNEEQLFSPAPQALMPTADATRIATYEDMRCPAAVGYRFPDNPSSVTLIYGFPLDAALNFEQLYRSSIEWLMAEE